MVTDTGNLFGTECKCAICGKEFIKYPTWVYKAGVGYGIKFFCSWGCLRQFEKKKIGRRDREDKIRQAVADGLTISEIANLMSMDRRSVTYWVEKIAKENAEHERKTEPEACGKED